MERLTSRELWWGSQGKTDKAIDYKVDEERRCVTHEGSSNFLIADKLAEYEDLEEHGKLLKLPCKVGDILYFPYIDSVTKEKVISKEKVTEIGLYYRVGNGELSSCSEIGSIIFVEETDAENALQKTNEMEGEE